MVIIKHLEFTGTKEECQRFANLYLPDGTEKENRYFLTKMLPIGNDRYWIMVIDMKSEEHQQNDEL